MKYILSVFITLCLGFLVGYQTEKPERGSSQNSTLEQESPALPQNILFTEEEKTSIRGTMNINAVTNHQIPQGYGMYADFQRVLSAELVWPEKTDADYLYLGVGSNLEAVQRKPWGDIYSGYVTGKTEITLALPESWDDEDILNRVLFVRLWEKKGSRWSKEDFAFPIKQHSTYLCDDTVELVCGSMPRICSADECTSGEKKTFLNTCELEKAGAKMFEWGMCDDEGMGNTCEDIYEPVCGKRYPAGCEAYLLEAQSNDGFDIPPKCQLIQETYANTCELKHAGAEMMYWGECNQEKTGLQKKAEYICENATEMGLGIYAGKNELSTESMKGGEVLECEDGYTRIREPNFIADLGDVIIDEYFNVVARCGAYQTEDSVEAEICTTVACRSTGIHLCEDTTDENDYHCPALYDPVCAAVDGEEQTFSNACEAKKRNAKIIHAEKCEEKINEDEEDTNEGGSEIPMQCSVWYDGCNTCDVHDGEVEACTEMACQEKTAPRCVEYNEEYNGEIICEDKNEPVCGVKYGKLQNYTNACELYKDTADMFAYNECDNTFRARLFEMTDGEENFIIKIDDPETVVHARNVLNGHETEKTHITALIENEVAEVYENFDWSFRVDPRSISFFETGKDICDVDIVDVEENIEKTGQTGLTAERWCPQNSSLVREIAGTYVVD